MAGKKRKTNSTDSGQNNIYDVQILEKIKNTAEQWRISFDAITDLVSVQDRNQKFIRLNKAFVDVFKKNLSDLAGRSCYQVFHSTNEPPPDCPFKQVMKNKKPVTKEFFEPSMGIYVEVSVSPIFNAKGEIESVVHIVKNITERRQIEEVLKSSEIIYNSFINSTLDIVFLKDENFRHIMVNKAYENFLGKNANEVLGKTDFEILPEAVAKNCRKSDLVALKSEGVIESEEAVTDNIYESRKFRVKLKNGKYGIGGYVRNITERRKNEELFKKLETKVSSIVDNALVGVYQSNVKGEVLYINKPLLKMFEYDSKEDINSRGGARILYKYSKDREKVLSLIKEKQYVEDYELEFVTKTGKQLFIYLCMRKDGNILSGTVVDITRLKLAENNLQKAKNYSEMLLTFSPVAIFTVDLKGRITRWNNRDQEITGYSAEEAIGKSCNLFMDSPCKDKCGLYSPDVKKPVISRECTLTRKDGQKRIISKSADFLIGENGGIIGGIETMEDITERKRAEETLKETERIKSELLISLKEAQQIGKSGSCEIDLQTHKVWWSEETYRIFGLIPQEFVPCFEDNGKFIHPDDLEKYIKSFEHTLQSGELLNMDLRLVANDGLVKSCNVRGKVIYDDSGQPLRFAGTITDITERKRMEDALRKSEEDFRNTFEQSAVGISHVGLDGRWIFINHKYCDIVGYTHDELVKKTFKEITHPEDIKIDYENFQLLINKKKVHYKREKRYIRKDGSIVWVDLTVSAIYDSLGNIKYLVAVIEDISNRKKAEAELQNSENRFRELFDNMKNCVAVYEAKDNGNDFIFKDFNKTAEKIDKIRKKELLGKSILKVFPGVKEFGLFNIFQEVWKTGIPKSHPVTFYKDQRISGWRENFIYKLPTGEIVALYNDITERKQVEDELTKSRQLLIEAQRLGKIGNWEFDLDTQKIWWSDEVYELYERDKTLGPPSVEEEAQYYSPEEAEKLHNFARLVVEKGKEIKYDLTVKLPSGKTAFFSSVISPVKNREGRITKLFGTVQDITERKEAEGKLKESFEKYRKALNQAVTALSTTSEYRDPYTTGHQQRVTKLACAIAREMDFSEDKVIEIRIAGSLHDIGKINIPIEILTKPSRLNDIEMELVRTHAQTGYNILKEIEFSWPIAKIVLQHHERLNGSGYPLGAKDKDILIEAKIIAVADVVEAMSSHRPYRPSLGVEKALEEIAKGKNVLYESKVVDICIKLFIEKEFRFE